MNRLRIIDFKFERMSDSAQFCTDVAIHSFHEEGFIEFKAYCMINSMAEPMDLEIEKVGENEYKCHVLILYEMTAMSEICILVSGRMECREVKQQLKITVKEKMVKKGNAE